MGIPLRVLIVEDSEDDTHFLLNFLKKNGYETTHERVEEEGAMRTALLEKPWDVVLCDYRLPQFDGLRGLQLIKDMSIDIPFIIVSGVIGEDLAVECMKAGAHDYVMKNNLQRIIPVLQREMGDAAVRKERRRIEGELNNLALVVKSASELIGLFTPDGTMTFMNDAMSKKLGVTHDEVNGCHILDLFSLDYKELAKKVILPELMKQGSWQGDIQYRNMHTGAAMYVRASFFPINDTKTGALLCIANIATDITEQKKAEKDIMHLASFPQFSPILILEISKEGDATYVNPAMQQALSEMFESDATLFIPQDISVMIKEQKISVHKEVEREIFLHGRTYLEKICFLPHFNAIRIYAHDITARKKMEEDLRRSELYYRLIFENSAEAILLTAPDGRIFSANPEACRMTQRSEDEICCLGRNCIIDLADPRLPAALEERERTGRFKGELTCLRADGRKFPCELSSVVFRDMDGQLRTSMMIRDLTEQKRMEEALSQRKQQFENMIKNVPGIIYKFAVHPDGSMTFPYISDNVRNIGLEPEEVMKDAQKLIDKISPDDLPGLMQSIDASARSLQTWNWQGRFIVSGEERFYKGISQPSKLADGTVEWDGLITDVTEFKMSEDKVKTAHEQLKALAKKMTGAEERERKRIARELHDTLSQSLTAIGINLSIMSSKLPMESRNMIEHYLNDTLALIDEAAENVRKLVFDLRVPILDDYGLVAAIEWFAKRCSEKTGITFVLKGGGSHSRLNAEIELEIFRIIQEVFTNILRHSKATQAVIMFEESERDIRISIEDNGVGFNYKKMTRYDRQGDFRSWGLLSMMERAEAFGGKLHIESQSGSGTKVTIEVLK